MRWSSDLKSILLGHLGLVAGFFLVAWWSGGAAGAPGSVSPGPSYQAAEDQFMCPISNEETETASKTFEKIAAVFTEQPRCVNCHGAVNPFAAVGENTHGGGRQDILYEQEEFADPVTGKVNVVSVQDFNATFNQCQDCHSAFPGFWRIPTQDKFFVGKTADQLCLQMHEQLRDPETFLGHIQFDIDPTMPFLLEGFKGTRGLNELGQDTVEGEYKLEPPVGVTQAGLLALARQWVDETGGVFGRDPECGCVPLHYALLVKERTTTDVVRGAGGTTLRSIGGYSTDFMAPLTVEADGSVVGEAKMTRAFTDTSTGSTGTCVTHAKIPGTWTAASKISDFLLELKFAVTTTAIRATVDCIFESGPFSHSETRLASDGQYAFELNTTLDLVQSFSFPLPGGKHIFEFTIIKVD